MAAASSSSNKGIPQVQEGYLTPRTALPCIKIQSRKYYCVLFSDLLQLYDNKKSYAQKEQNKAQIDLQQVCSISETVQVKGHKASSDFCFKLELFNEEEIIFATESKEKVKCWVECLKHTKEFYQPYVQKQLITKKDETSAAKIQEKDVNNKDNTLKLEPGHVKLSITMSHGPKYTISLRLDGDVNHLWASALKWLPGHFCEKCENCCLRRGIMELWSVNSEGVASKVEQSCDDFYNNELFLLEHNYKLLIVYFEDTTFLVSPVHLGIKAREVPSIEIFAQKLRDIECNNAQLYLETTSKTVMPFSPDDQPLTRHLPGKLLLKSRALVLLPDNFQITAEKYKTNKIKKICEERRQKEALQQFNRKALKNVIPADNMATVFGWSSSRLKDKPVKHLIIDVPTDDYASGGQRSAPFCPPNDLTSHYSHDGTNNAKSRSKSEVIGISQNPARTNKKRTVSESHTLERKGAIRRLPARSSTDIDPDTTLVSGGGERQNAMDLSNEQLDVSSNNHSVDEMIQKSPESTVVTSQSSNYQPEKHISCVSEKNVDVLLISPVETIASLDSKDPPCIADHGDSGVGVNSEGQSNHHGYDSKLISTVEESKENHDHSCDFYTVESPYKLEPILNQYSRLRAGEEEVNGVSPPPKLCLSSVHLIYEDGCWVIDNDVGIIVDDFTNSEIQDLEVFTLSDDLKVAFHRSKRIWIVRRVQNLKPNAAESEKGELVESESKEIFTSSNDVDCGNQSTKGICSPITSSTVLPTVLPTIPQSFPELTMLVNAIQKIFFQASLFEILDDTKYPDVRKVICLDFCSAFNSVLSHGLKRKKTFLGAAKYTVWEIIEEATTATMSKSTLIAKKIKDLGFLEDKVRLDLFVCECFNEGAEILAEWFEDFTKQRNRLSKYYDEEALVMKLQKDVLEHTSRLAHLKFRLSHFNCVKQDLEIKRRTHSTICYE